MDVRQCSHPPLKENFRIFSREEKEVWGAQPQNPTPPLDNRKFLNFLLKIVLVN